MKLTNKEAIANLKHIYGIVSPDIQRSLDVAFKALEERPQGEWEPKGFFKECSHCHFTFGTCDFEPDNYCPNCGAEMKQVITCVNPCGDSTTIDTSQKTIC